MPSKHIVSFFVPISGLAGISHAQFFPFRSTISAGCVIVAGPSEKKYQWNLPPTHRPGRSYLQRLSIGRMQGSDQYLR